MMLNEVQKLGFWRPLASQWKVKEPRGLDSCAWLIGLEVHFFGPKKLDALRIERFSYICWSDHVLATFPESKVWQMSF